MYRLHTLHVYRVVKKHKFILLRACKFFRNAKAAYKNVCHCEMMQITYFFFLKKLSLQSFINFVSYKSFSRGLGSSGIHIALQKALVFGQPCT